MESLDCVTTSKHFRWIACSKIEGDTGRIGIGMEFSILHVRYSSLHVSDQGYLANEIPADPTLASGPSGKIGPIIISDAAVISQLTLFFIFNLPTREKKKKENAEYM